MNERYFATIETQAAGVSDVAVRGSLSRLAKLHRDLLATAASIRGNTLVYGVFNDVDSAPCPARQHTRHDEEGDVVVPVAGGWI